MTNSNERIGFRLRLNAMILDGMVIGIAGSFLGGLIGGAIGNADAGAAGGIIGGMIGAIQGISFLATAFAVWETLTGAALGKLCFGMKIKSADGSPASPSQLCIRSLVKYNGMVLALAGSFTGVLTLVSIAQLGNTVYFIGCLLACGGEKQALQDKVAGTAVYPK